MKYYTLIFLIYFSVVLTIGYREKSLKSKVDDAIEDIEDAMCKTPNDYKYNMIMRNKAIKLTLRYFKNINPSLVKKANKTLFTIAKQYSKPWLWILLKGYEKGKFFKNIKNKLIGCKSKKRCRKLVMLTVLMCFTDNLLENSLCNMMLANPVGIDNKNGHYIVDKQYDFGNLTGGNLNIVLPKIAGKLVINSFPSNKYIESQEQNIIQSGKLNRKHISAY